VNPIAASTIGAESGALYINTACIRDSASGSHILQFDGTTHEVLRRDNKLMSLGDCEAMAFSSGAALRYDTASSKWQMRDPHYFLYGINGSLVGTGSPSQVHILVTSVPSSWNAFMVEVPVKTDTGSGGANFTVDTTTGVVSGFNTDVLYRVTYNVTFAPAVTATSGHLTARIRGGSSSGTVLRESRIAVRVSMAPVSLRCETVVKGYSAFYFSLQLSNSGTYTSNTNDCSVSVAIVEV